MVSLPVRAVRRAVHNETNTCSKCAQVRVNCTHFKNDTSCIGGAVVIILLIRLWRSWQDADKAAEPLKPNTPQTIWMMGVSRLINAMLAAARLGSKMVLSQNGFGSVEVCVGVGVALVEVCLSWDLPLSTASQNFI